MVGERLLNGELLNYEQHQGDEMFESVRYINKVDLPGLCTPLITSAANGHVSCVRALILAGADKALENSDSRTAQQLVKDTMFAVVRQVLDLKTKYADLNAQFLLDEDISEIVAEVKSLDQMNIETKMAVEILSAIVEQVLIKGIPSKHWYTTSEQVTANPIEAAGNSADQIDPDSDEIKRKQEMDNSELDGLLRQYEDKLQRLAKCARV